MKRFVRPTAAFAVVSVLASCATILHPERKGNRGGSLDTVPLVVDILLFIPGLIPGVVALAVDFTTGAIYTGGGSADASEVGRRGKIALRAKDLPAGSDVSLALVDADGVVVDSDKIDGAKARGYGRLSVDLRRAAEAHPEAGEVPLWLEMQVDGQVPARYALVMK